jgi:hypothetical protein
MFFFKNDFAIIGAFHNAICSIPGNVHNTLRNIISGNCCGSPHYLGKIAALFSVPLYR